MPGLRHEYGALNPLIVFGSIANSLMYVTC